MRTTSLILFLALCYFPPAADASLYRATPENYRAVLQQLQPGDTLLLASGQYRDGLPLHGLMGTAKQPILISGPRKGARAVYIARAGHNTVSIANSAYITLRNVELDGRGELADAVKAEGHSSWAHHIVLENLYIHNHDANQQIVGISTKCPAWGWVIRNNIIRGAGTGIYLGNSDGSAPFVDGLIEYNLVVDTVGYNLQIKHQIGRPQLEEMPQGNSSTIIRHNVFSKANKGSAGHSARPNVLVGHFPLTGPGSNDSYLIYSNFFYQNPNEALFQGEGNIALYNNVFVNTFGDAIILQPHHDVPRSVNIFYNTIVAAGNGIRLAGADQRYAQRVVANAVFARLPITGGEQTANTAGTLTEAEVYLMNPFAPIGKLNLQPRPAQLLGETIDTQPFRAFVDWNRDYSSRLRGKPVHGAFACKRGERPLRLEVKSPVRSGRSVC
jgi:hypothetical protein